MNAATTAQVLIKCPQCYRIIQLVGEQYDDGDGELYVDSGPVMHALGLHMRVGCIAGADDE